MSTPPSIVRMTGADIDALFEFRKRVFPSSRVQLDRDRWRWTYEGNPWTDHRIPTWVLKTKGRIAGSIGAIPCRMKVGSEVVTAWFGTDYFVEDAFKGLPALRLLSTLRAQGPLHIGANISDSARRLFLKIGYVDLSSHLYIASASLGGQRQKGVHPLSWLKRRVLRMVRTLVKTAMFRTELSQTLPASYPELWKRISAAQSAGLEKDADHMRWRYESCPVGAPRFISVVRRQRLVAMAVVDVHKSTQGRDSTGLILDLLLPGTDRGALMTLIAGCLECLEEAGCSGCLLHWNAPWAKPILRAMGFRLSQSDLGLMVWVAPGAESLKVLQTPGAWTLSLGDTDRF